MGNKTGKVTIAAATAATCTATIGGVTPTGTDLTVTVVGNGSVTSSSASGINACTAAAPCTAKFQAGDVTLTATPTNATDTVAWSAGCTGTGTVTTVTIADGTAATCTATISGMTPTGTDLTVTVVGNGSVTSSSASGINACTSAAPCTAKFYAGDVILTATPTNTTDTVAWSAGCTGTGTVTTVTIVDGTAATCTATISSGGVTPTNTDLTVTVVGNGIVTKEPTGETCATSSPDCSAYSVGDTVALNAAANIGANFDGWTDACSSEGKKTLILVKMDNAKSCTATFISSTKTQTLTLTKEGSGTGTITSENDELNCGATCTATVPQGNTLKLTATADATSTFAGWSVDCASAATGNPAVVTLDADKSCAATFNLKSQEATCFDQGGLLTTTGECLPAAALTSESSTGGTGSIFKGGVSKQVNSQYGAYKTTDTVYQLLDSVKTAGILKIDAADKGKKVDVLVAGLHVSSIYQPEGLAWYMLVGCNFCPLGWNLGVESIPTQEALPVLEKIKPLKTVTLDSDYLTVYMYEGQLYYAGPLDIYLGYRVVDTGKIVFSTTPIHLDIQERPAQ